MSRRDKLRQRIEKNPKNVAFRDLRLLLELYGFELRRTRGSHHSFVGEVGGRKILLIVPFRRPLKSVYVKRALDLIGEIEAETPPDETNDDTEEQEQDDEDDE